MLATPLVHRGAARADPPGRADSDPFSALTPAQSAAADHRGGPLLVVAGPGSGKTATLAARVARLVLAGVAPQRILLLTFSRRAAREMTQRAGTLLQRALGQPANQPLPELPWAGTFHAVGARLLRERAATLGIAPGFTVLDRADAEDLLAIERQALGFAAQEKRFPLKGTCLAIYSRVLNTVAPLDTVLDRDFPWCAAFRAELRALFAAYERAKQQQQVLDYDDLLQCWAEAMLDPATATAIGGRFDEVLVDEAQDCNALQMAILHALKPDGCGLTLVGDDAQSIYAFRGADVRLLLDFPSRHAGAVQVVALERNYRSTPALVAASNAVIAQAARRLPKTMVSALAEGPRPQLVTVADDAAQTRWVADEVLRLREGGIALRRQAVLFRTATHSAGLELELARRGIPFVKYGGLKFIESAHVKDLLSLLRWAQNPAHTLAGYRCAMLVAGIGPATARRLQQMLATASAPQTVWQSFEPPPAAAEAWRALRSTWQDLHDPQAAGSRWPDAVERALQWYRPQLERLHDDAAARWADLRQLQQIAAGYPSRERFLAELTLDPPSASSDNAGDPHRDEDWLVLSTIHSAKGQEWSAVQVLNVVDGCMPADLAAGDADQVDEERRLLYVAMTRARRHLSLLLPQRFHVTQQARFGDRHVYAIPSRFLSPGVIACCDASVATVESADPCGSSAVASV
ncbi:MAG: ATP-dependent helicase, partial [Rubrivivax sp.]